MKTLHLMVGLPRSGKSTEAKKMGYPIVEPDAIRYVVHRKPWQENTEPLIWAIAKIMVESLFRAGHEDVILDATNHTHDRRKIWESTEWVNQYHYVDTDKETCIKRAIETKQEYLIPTIKRMKIDYEPIGGEHVNN